ncbi:hypothetical protein JOM56_005419 [Amanita muscaria]
MLTYVQRYVVAMITQALLYGIYLATLTQCFRWFIFTDEGWKPREKINSVTVALGTIFVFLMTTINMTTTLAYLIKFFRRDETQLYGIRLMINTSQALAILSIDGILIYRCWIVHEKSWRVICVPVPFWLGSLACSAVYLYFTLERQPPFNSLQIEEKLITSLYVCNITTTIYTTAAIIYRIWYTSNASGGSPKRLNYIMRILAESGVLYTSTIIFSLVGSVLTGKPDPTWVDYLIGDVSDAINFSMAGISFNLLIIRVYQSRVELRDSLADSKNDDGVRTLSGMQFNNLQVTVSSEGPPARRVDEVIDEIQEHRRSSDGIHVN